MNQDATRRFVALVLDAYARSGSRTTAVLGLSYKPNTPVTEESPSVAVVEALLAAGADIAVYDPLAADAARRRFGERVRVAASVKDAMTGASFTVIALPLPECAAIDDSYVSASPAVIVDCWRVLDPRTLSSDVSYVALGRYHGGTA